MTTGYSPFTIDPLSGDYHIFSNLGVIVDAGSPLFAGVNTANVQTQFQADSSLTPGATLVASWASGRLAIAYNVLASSSVVGLNLFPDGFYSSDTDTQRLVANALQFSIDNQVRQAPEPASLLLLGAGLGMVAVRRKRRS